MGSGAEQQVVQCSIMSTYFRARLYHNTLSQKIPVNNLRIESKLTFHQIFMFTDENQNNSCNFTELQELDSILAPYKILPQRVMY